MAKPNDPTDSLLREVDDDLRHDRMMALWRQYRKPLLAAVIALVVATAGASLWKNYQEKKFGDAMQEFAIAQKQYEAGNYKDAADDFATTADISINDNLRDQAHLWQARALEKDGRTAEAVKLLEQIATTPEGSDLIWRDLACIRLVGLDASKHACLNEGASPLSAERDLIRAATLWQDGKSDEAGKILHALANDANAPKPVRERAQNYLSAAASPAKAE